MNNNVLITEALQELNKMSRMSDSKSLNESTSRKMDYNSYLRESIRRILRRLNEDQMSPEDARDSEILRGIYQKRAQRKNARLTPEEAEVLNRYNLVDDDGTRISYFGLGFPSLSNGVKQQRVWKGRRDWEYIPAEEVNLADRARKIPQRGPNGYLPAAYARAGKYPNTLEAERAMQNQDMQSNLRDLQYDLDRRRKKQSDLDGLDATYAARMAQLFANRDAEKSQITKDIGRVQGDIDAKLAAARQRRNAARSRMNQPEETQEESYNRRRLKESIKRVLRRMNEAQMSPEDAADSEILRRILNKVDKRINAKLTPEEQEVLARYGLSRQYHTGYFGGRGAAIEKNGREFPMEARWRPDYNLANKARTMGTRDYAREVKYYKRGDDTFQQGERSLQNRMMQGPYNTMSRSISYRDMYDDDLANIDAEYDERIQQLLKQKELARRDKQASRDEYQADIDSLLTNPDQRDYERRHALTKRRR